MSKDTGDFSRILSKNDVFALAFGAMIGWGWIVLAGDWIQTAGTIGAIIAFLLGGIMVLFVGLTYAELTAAMPKCGGEHVFSHRALGNSMSFICTWAIILGYISVVAFEAVAFPTVIEYVFPKYIKGYMYTIVGYNVYFTWVMVGILSSAVITFINYIGVKPAAFVQGVLTFLVGIIGLAFFVGALSNGNINNISPIFKDGLSGILKVVIMTPFMFVGFDVIPQAAEEINLPFDKIGKIILLSVAMGILWYIMIIFSVSVSLSDQAMESSKMVVADSMKSVYFNSDIAAKLIIIAGIGGILTSWNSFYIGASRAIYAMAESKMLPKFLAYIHPKYKTPSNAVLLVGVLSTIAPFFGRQMLLWLVNAGGLTIVISYLIVAVSFLVLRYKEPNMERPYKVKAPKLVGIISICLSLSMIALYLPGAPASLTWPYEWGIILGWIMLGIVFFIWAKFTYASKENQNLVSEYEN